MAEIPDRLRTVLLEAMMIQAMRAPGTAGTSNLPDGWQLCWCSDCSASLVMTDVSDGFVAYQAIADVATLVHADDCPWAWLAARPTGHRLRRVDEWDGVDPPNYVSPVDPGDRVVLVRGSTVLVTTVVRVRGYSPGVVEVEGGLRVDLPDGWLLGILS